MNPERRMRQLEDEQMRRLFILDLDENLEDGGYLVLFLLLGTGLTLVGSLGWLIWWLMG